MDQVVQEVIACCHAAFPAAGLTAAGPSEVLRHACLEDRSKQLTGNTQEAGQVQDCQLVVGAGFFHKLYGRYLRALKPALAANAAAAMAACAAVAPRADGIVQQWRAFDGALYVRIRQDAWARHVDSHYQRAELEEGGRCVLTVCSHRLCSYALCLKLRDAIAKR